MHGVKKNVNKCIISEVHMYNVDWNLNMFGIGIGFKYCLIKTTSCKWTWNMEKKGCEQQDKYG